MSILDLFYKRVANRWMKPSAFGIDGFGGRCGVAAVAINHALFDGKLPYILVYNSSLYKKHGQFKGHVALVLPNGRFLDSDGEEKEFEDIESWGMLDEEEVDEDGNMLFSNPEEAYDVASKVIGESEAIELFGCSSADVDEMIERILTTQNAKKGDLNIGDAKDE